MNPNIPRKPKPLAAQPASSIKPGKAMSPILLMTALLLPLPALAGGGMASVPERFVGRWAGSSDSCGSDADDLTLRLTRNHITHWESDGPIKAVVVRGDTELALISELSGEGETWLSVVHFTLSEDGNRLIDTTTRPGKELVRHRCTGTGGAQARSSSRPALLRDAA